MKNKITQLITLSLLLGCTSFVYAQGQGEQNRVGIALHDHILDSIATAMLSYHESISEIEDHYGAAISASSDTTISALYDMNSKNLINEGARSALESVLRYVVRRQGQDDDNTRLRFPQDIEAKFRTSQQLVARAGNIANSIAGFAAGMGGVANSDSLITYYNGEKTTLESELSMLNCSADATDRSDRCDKIPEEISVIELNIESERELLVGYLASANSYKLAITVEVAATNSAVSEAD